MKEIIYRDDAVDSLYPIRCKLQMMDDTYSADKVMHGLWLAENAIKKLPSAQSEVICCEHCKHSYLFRPWGALDDECESRFCRKFRQSFNTDSDLLVEDDDFCSFAERK